MANVFYAFRHITADFVSHRYADENLKTPQGNCYKCITGAFKTYNCPQPATVDSCGHALFAM